MNVGEWHGYPGFVQMTAGWEEAFGVISYELREIELPDERSAPNRRPPVSDWGRQRRPG